MTNAIIRLLRPLLWLLGLLLVLTSLPEQAEAQRGRDRPAAERRSGRARRSVRSRRGQRGRRVRGRGRRGQRRRRPPRRARPARAGQRRGGEASERSGPARVPPSSGREEAELPPGAVPPVEGGDEEAAGAQTQVVEEGGRKVTVIRFTGLDISGRLRSPQILYFLSRVRAEFDHPRLPHRSFIPELERSAHEDR